MKSSILVISLLLNGAYAVSPLCKRIGDDLSGSAPVIETVNGPVRGCDTEAGGFAFTIPFAEPPIGDLRFKGPTVKENWKGIYDGTQFATMCPQFSGSHEKGLYIGDEDCLYLSVHQPPSVANGSQTEPLPVMFWIYGGAFMVGDTYEFGFYDTTNFLKQHNVIIVSVNYRVGAFGFLSHEALQEEDVNDSTGNMGLRDQRLGMQWVQDNIANFGGDPNQVTIFGESAGAISVCAHVANAMANEGLFQHAIMESGTCDSPELFFPVKDANIFGNDYSSLVVGCDANVLGNQGYLECMRGVNVSDILYGTLVGLEPLNASQLAKFNYIPPLFPLVPFSLVVDGSTEGIPELPLTSLKNGDHVMEIPMIMGTNKDEGTIFVPFVKSLYNIEVRMNLDDFYIVIDDLICTDNFPGESCDPNVILSKYNNCSTYPHVDACAAAVLRDYIFTCPTRRSTGAMNALGQNVYQYQFVYQPHWLDMEELGNYHTSELYFVWDNPWPLRGNDTRIHNFNDDDNQMASDFGHYWTNMATYGNPNGDVSDGESDKKKNGDVAEWPSVIKDPNSLDGMSHMKMELPPTLDYALEDEICDFWDTYLAFN